jgi:hypothetical protein
MSAVFDSAELTVTRPKNLASCKINGFTGFLFISSNVIKATKAYVALQFAEGNGSACRSSTTKPKALALHSEISPYEEPRTLELG